MLNVDRKVLKSKIKQLMLIAPLCVAVSLQGCTKQNGKSSLFDTSDAGEMDKSSWLEKVSSALRSGDGIGPDDDVDALLAKSESDIVDELLSDPRFGDTSLAFNLFFLGRSVNKLKTKDQGQDSYTYNRSIFSSPQALASAKAVVSGGDFFELFEKEPALVSLPLGKPKGAIGLSDEEIRTKIKDEVFQLLENTLVAFQPDSNGVPTDKSAGCNSLNSNNFPIRQAFDRFGFSNELITLILEKWMNPLNGFNPPGVCQNDQISAQEVVTKVKALQGSFASMMADMIAVPTDVKIKNVKDLLTLSFEAPEGAGSLAEPLTSAGFWSNLKNSSTNYNRKRSAYILRTYFCDDLTPINVEVPTNHAGNAHASDPACIACHFKLDPMGGLFRYNGQNGSDFQAAQNYIFDDFKSLDGAEYEEYLNNWKDDQGQWKVGYYVGLNKPHSKWKGDQLSDLWSFFKQSKEVKQCLVRRMAEYFLGPDQVYDAGWLEEVSKSLKPGTTSGEQFKGVVKSLVTSNTFKQADPVAGKCYDFDSDSASADPDKVAPCEIAHIIKKRCATCHTDAEDLGVDFTTWTKLDDGSYGFVHLNDNRDAQLSKKESLKIILERITSTDPSYKMPQGGALSELDKQTLYKWLDKEIN